MAVQQLNPDKQVIREALEELLASAAFSRATRQAMFLRFVVERSLDDANKSYSALEIATECFGRPPVEDPNDAYVRNIASQTRHSLKNHYDSLAQPPRLLINLAGKGYLPVYSQASTASVVGAPPVAEIATTAATPAEHSPNRLLATIAVIPFQCMAGGELHGIMGELISDSLITSLAKSKYMRVISRRSSSQFDTLAYRAGDLGNKLHTDYIVKGRYYVQGDSLILQIELCCCESEEVIWAKRLRSSVEALISESDDLIDQALSGITHHLLDHELQRALTTPLKSLQCHSLLIGGINIMHRNTPRDFKRAREMLELLAQRNPDHASPYAQLAYWGILDSVRDADNAETEAKREFVLKNTELALQRDSLHPIALTAQGMIRGHFDSNFEQARDLFEQALQHSPNEAATMARLSVAQLYTESASKARATANRAIEISQFDPELYFFHSAAGTAAFGEKNYHKAAEHTEISGDLFPNHPSNLRTLIASYTAMNDHHMAQKYKAKLLQLDPSFSLDKYRRNSPFPKNEIIQRLSHYLEKSGIPASANT